MAHSPNQIFCTIGHEFNSIHIHLHTSTVEPATQHFYVFTYNYVISTFLAKYFFCDSTVDASISIVVNIISTFLAIVTPQQTYIVL